MTRMLKRSKQDAAQSNPPPRVVDAHPVDYRDAIIKLYNSPEYQELNAYYNRKSMFSVLGIARREIRHSNMLAWLLDPASAHGLGKTPMRRFLQLLATAKRSFAVNRKSYLPSELMDGFISGAFDIGRVEVQKEVAVTGPSSKEEGGRLDLLLFVELTFGNTRKVLPVLLENKVNSSEHLVRSLGVKQTDGYYAWAKRIFADRRKYYSPLFVFLTPDGTMELTSGTGEFKRCSCEKYLTINYQMLVDGLIEPCMRGDLPSEVRYFLGDYLRCLSFESLGEDEGKANVIMAIAPKERELLHAFWEKNEPLLLAAMYALSEDPTEELDEDVRKLMRRTVEGVSKKDKTKFKIGPDGDPLFQGRMVLAVVKDYVQKHPGISFRELSKVFPASLSLPNKYGVVAVLTDTIKNNPRPRYFLEDKIRLADGTVVVVGSQWGRDEGRGNIPRFVEKAKSLGYEIIEVQK